MQDKQFNICVVGDSFCGHRSNAEFELLRSFPWSWVNLLSTDYGKNVIGKSFPGQSYYHQRRWFYQNFQNIKDQGNTVLIFCHTNSSRLPHNNNFPVTSWVTKTKKESDSNELKHFDPDGKLFDLANDFFSSNLFVKDFYSSVMLSWLAELPELTRNFKKVIHFFGFDDKLGQLPDHRHTFTIGDLVTDNSVVVLNTLVSMTFAERGTTNTFGGPDVEHANHWNKHNNFSMFEEVKHIIEQVPGKSYYEFDLAKWNLVDDTLVKKIKQRNKS